MLGRFRADASFPGHPGLFRHGRRVEVPPSSKGFIGFGRGLMLVQPTLPHHPLRRESILGIPAVREARRYTTRISDLELDVTAGVPPAISTSVLGGSFARVPSCRAQRGCQRCRFASQIGAALRSQ